MFALSSKLLNIPAVQLDHDFAVAVIVNFLEFANVAWISSQNIAMN